MHTEQKGMGIFVANDIERALLQVISSPVARESLTKLLSNSDAVNSPDFDRILQDESEKFAGKDADYSRQQEVRQLIMALDKSILGTVAEEIDVEELSGDLLSGDGRQSVISELVQGHVQALVTTPDKEDKGFDISENISKEMSLNKDEDDAQPKPVEDSLEEIAGRLGDLVSRL